MTDGEPSPDDDEDELIARWRDSPLLTPRMAAGMAGLLGMWAALLFSECSRSSSGAPTHEVMPLAMLDRRCLFEVGESRAWIASVAEGCGELAEALEMGLNPLGVPHRPIDEILITIAMKACAREWAENGGEAVASVPRRPYSAVDDVDDPVREGDWAAARFLIERHSTLLPDLAKVTSPGFLGVPAALRAYPPHTWFDLREGPVT